jgi:hypothetical protein
MIFGVYFLQIVDRNPGVYLGGFQGFMTQHLLQISCRGAYSGAKLPPIPLHCDHPIPEHRDHLFRSIVTTLTDNLYRRRRWIIGSF